MSASTITPVAETSIDEITVADLLPPPAPVDDLRRRELLSAAAAILLIAHGRGEPPQPSTPPTRTIETARGPVDVPAHPRRIIAIWHPTLAAMTILGFQPIGSVGLDNSPLHGLGPYLPEGFPLDEVEVIGPPGEHDLEKMLLLQPDLILGADSPNIDRDGYEKLSDIAPAVLVDWSGTASWRTHVVGVAEALGVPEKAGEVARAYEEAATSARSEASADATGLEVSVVRLADTDALRIETPHSFVGQVIDDIGLGRPSNQLIPDEGRDYVEISLERIREAEGDLVFVIVHASEASTWDEIQRGPLWQSLPAQQRGRVVVVDYAWWLASNYFGAHRIIDDVAAALQSL